MLLSQRVESSPVIHDPKYFWQIIYFHVEWRRAENSKYEQLKVSPALDLGIVFNMAAI